MLGPMRFGYYCDAGHDSRVLYMAAQWRDALGFTRDQLDLRCTHFGWPRTGPSGVYDIRRHGWGADFSHPDNQNRGTFSCGMRDNESGYCSPAYDALLNQGAQAASYAASLPFYHQAEQLLVADAPVLFLRYGESIWLVRPWVINYVQTPLDRVNVGDAFYENIQIVAH
jgi:oligopeptide transport system substrate-binding protein